MRSPTMWILLVLCGLLAGAPSLAGGGLPADDPVLASVDPGRDTGPAIETTIVNGRITGSQPSAGALLLGQDPNSAGVACSGVLVGCDSFLTSAQCVCNSYPCDPAQIDPTQFKVFLQNGGIFDVAEVKVSPEWGIPGPDTAVLKLSTPVNGIAPTPINTVAPVPSGTEATIVGFGMGIEEFGGIKRVGAVRTSACAGIPSYYPSVCWFFTFPLGDPGEDSNHCYGDEGGPLFVDFGNGPVVAGTHSGGYNINCAPNDLAWATDLYNDKDFILSQVPDHGVASCGNLPQIGSEGATTTEIAADLDATTTSRVHSFLVPPDVDVLRVTMNADSFEDPSLLNFDLYVNYAVPPGDGVESACVREGLGNYASCEIQKPRPGTWYAKVNAAANLFGEWGVAPNYQVTASSFRTTTYAGVIDVALSHGTGASWPGGVVPTTVRVENVSDSFQRTTLTTWVIPPSGAKYAVRRSNVPLEAGEVRELPIPVPVPSTAELGEWMVIVESNASGLIDKGWNSFEVQLDRAAEVELTSPAPQIQEGESWAYTSTIRNVSGLKKVAAATWRLVDPAGAETTWSKSIPLAPGQTWTEPATLDPPTGLGVYTLTFETTIDAYVATASIRFEVLAIDRASLTLITGMTAAMAMTPDGRIVVGNYGTWLDGYPFGATILRTDTMEVEYIGNFESATDVSDDGSVVVGSMRHPESNKPMAAIWNVVTQQWQGLGLLAPPQTCGSDENTAIALSGDGSTAVGLTYSDHLGRPCDPYAFRWTEQTGMEILPRRNDGPNRQARADDVDYDGNVIVGWDDYRGPWRGTRWIADDPQSASDYEEQLLGSFDPNDPVNGGSAARAVSRNGIWIAGQAAGYASPTIGAYLWSEETGLIPIPNTRRIWGIWPEAVTNDGRTVIGTQGPYGTNYRQAIIWTADAGTRILSEWLLQLGADLSAVNGNLPYTLDMTADGKTILGITPGVASWIAHLPSAQPGTPPQSQTPGEQPAPEPTKPVKPAAGAGRLSLSE